MHVPNPEPQRVQAPEDAPMQTDIPGFWKSRLGDIEDELKQVKRGEVTEIARSPGGLPVYSVSYGQKDDLESCANFNSACAARNPAYYAHKTEATKPVVLIVGPVHGHEVENIVGTVNLIHLLETGAGHSGRQRPGLVEKAADCRLIIIPCGNPDGRRRCPYDSFVGLPHLVMTKYGQGTHKDGTLWGWPHAKSNHPMIGDVGILGCYYNDDGINPTHDDFFGEMAAETSAILDIARNEAPDIAACLHSNEDPPFLGQPGVVPKKIGLRVQDLAARLQSRFKSEGLPAGPVHELHTDDGTSLLIGRFNMNGAIYHVCGATAFTSECVHGVIRTGDTEPVATYEQILEIQMTLFDEILSFAIGNRLYWRKDQPAE